jgi:hypothetical protein
MAQIWSGPWWRVYIHFKMDGLYLIIVICKLLMLRSSICQASGLSSNDMKSYFYIYWSLRSIRWILSCEISAVRILSFHPKKKLITNISKEKRMMNFSTCRFLVSPQFQHSRIHAGKSNKFWLERKPFKNQEAVNHFKKMEMVSRSGFRAWLRGIKDNESTHYEGWHFGELKGFL